jgi:ribulose kinase
MAPETSASSSKGPHYIGIDVGTGSVRACVMNNGGEILSVAAHEITLWQPQTGYYVCSPCSQTITSTEHHLGAVHDRHMASHWQISKTGSSREQD